MERILIDATIIRLNDIYKSLPIYIFRYLDSIEEEEYGRYNILVLDEVFEYMRQRYSMFEYIVYNPYTSKMSSNRIIRFIQRCRLYKRTVECSGCQILFIPNDLVTFSSIKTTLKKVTVIHDMKSINNRTRFSIGFIINWIYYHQLLSNSDKIISTSKFTRDDILKFFPRTNLDKLQVIYNSVEISAKKNENWKDSYKNYILFVNTLLPYKNIMTFLNAFYLIKDKIKQNIIIVGKTTEYWTNEVIPFLEQKGLLHRVVHLENISNAELVKLYQDASLFVTTSLKEGFGYTPIEAAMCGCPVISSKCEALLDTTKDLLFYYEPAQDAGELSKQICYVINNPPSKKKLDDIAYKYREIYSPQKQYRNFKQIFNSL